MGRPLAQRLLAQGETVLDVPAKLAVRLGVFETHSTSQRTSRWPPRRDRGSLDRGLLGRQPGFALRVRTGGGACARCPAGDRRKRHRDRPHRSIRGFVRGRPDLEETIRRLRGYAEAGADCLYAPRIDNLEHVAAIVSAVSPKPVNLLINAPFTTVGQAAALEVRRISVGGTLARTAWGTFLQAAREIADAGTFSRFEHLPDVEQLFSR
jgi:hypothetical protein